MTFEYSRWGIKILLFGCIYYSTAWFFQNHIGMKTTIGRNIIDFGPLYFQNDPTNHWQEVNESKGRKRAIMALDWPQGHRTTLCNPAHAEIAISAASQTNATNTATTGIATSAASQTNAINTATTVIATSTASQTNAINTPMIISSEFGFVVTLVTMLFKTSSKSTKSTQLSKSPKAQVTAWRRDTTNREEMVSKQRQR